ncbi:cytochrome c [Thiosulfatimonas sediminis]|uniref:Cytochrome c n=1 Tax=Thiosulfatimonas sediminis TaxID=2675054 RepID=A0A6F8PWK7_9GAMM|nr:virulence protein RhuM/Fic/DOC family protein [Thiosulfatimonas sediminis]BBP46417.1 cytochrome c [Thiosulfatimonas sediminis]
MKAQNQMQLFTTPDGAVSLEVTLNQDTVWLNQTQLIDLFGRDQSVISRHINNVFKEGEVDKQSNMQKMHIANSDKPVIYYSLDVIISVGYRVKSLRGTQFRIWAAQILKQHLLQGYTLNQQRFEENAQALEQAIELVRKAARSTELTLESGRGLVDIVSRYTQTFLWLQRYDEGLLDQPDGQPGGNLPAIDEAESSLAELKQNLMAKGQASSLFAEARGDGLSAILGNLDQTAFGEPAYPTIESKAAHLLYFVVKNHPFNDGNKRSGAFLFVDFLHRNGRLFDAKQQPVINDTGLAALTLLVAESDPKQKNILIKLIMNMLSPQA